MLPREREVLKAMQTLMKESQTGTISAVSKRTRIPKSEVEYFCGRLEDTGYIVGHRLKGYDLTSKAIDLLEFLAPIR